MRPRLLAAAALLALLAGLAGCSAAGSLSMTPVDDADLADEASRSVPDAPDGTAEPAVVRDAIRNGSATANGTSPPVEPGLPFAHDGQYYDIEYEVVGEERGYGADVELDLNATDVDGETIAYDDLPAVDRRYLERFVTTDVEPRREGADVGVHVTFSGAEAEESVLVPDQEYAAVTHDGRTIGIEVKEPENVTLEVYRYEASVVAESDAAYAQQLRDRYAFTLSGLSDAERDVVSEAIGDTYYADDTGDDAFGSLVERFLAYEPVVDESSYGEGNWLVRYEGDLYWADLYYDQFADENRR